MPTRTIHESSLCGLALVVTIEMSEPAIITRTAQRTYALRVQLGMNIIVDAQAKVSASDVGEQAVAEAQLAQAGTLIAHALAAVGPVIGRVQAAAVALDQAVTAQDYFRRAVLPDDVVGGLLEVYSPPLDVDGPHVVIRALRELVAAALGVEKEPSRG